jgi:hypothetical protein
MGLPPGAQPRPLAKHPAFLQGCVMGMDGYIPREGAPIWVGYDLLNHVLC